MLRCLNFIPQTKGVIEVLSVGEVGKELMMRFAFLARFPWLTLWRRESGEAGVLEADAVF